MALTVALVAGCGSPSIGADDVELSRSTMRIPLDQSVNGGLATSAVMSLALANSTDRTLEVVGVETHADEGLQVEYIGYSSCQGGCVGTGFWTAETRARVEGGLDGTYPIPVPSTPYSSGDGPPPVHLVFLFSIPTDAGVAALQHGCLRLLGVSLELNDGATVPVDDGGDSFVAALRSEQDPEDSAGCDL